MSELQGHMVATKTSLLDIDEVRKRYLPITVCEVSARRRGLDLKIAAADYSMWVSKGLVPCRATPMATPRSGKTSGGNIETSKAMHDADAKAFRFLLLGVGVLGLGALGWWVFFSIASPLGGVRQNLATKLTDQSVLARLAKNDPNPLVRAAAVKKVNNLSTLAKIVANETSPDVRGAASASLDEKFTSAKQEDFVKMSILGNSELGAMAVDRLTDQASLAKVATSAPTDDVRGKAVAKLTDQAILSKIASTDQNCDVRLLAIEKLTDRSILDKIAAENSCLRVRPAAHSRTLQLLWR